MAEGILDGGVLGKKLCGEVGAADVFVVRRESIARETKGADPKLSTDVDLAATVGRIRGRCKDLRVSIEYRGYTKTLNRVYSPVRV